MIFLVCKVFWRKVQKVLEDIKFLLFLFSIYVSLWILWFGINKNDSSEEKIELECLVLYYEEYFFIRDIKDKIGF